MPGHLKSGDERVDQIVGYIFCFGGAALDEIEPISIGPRFKIDPLRSQHIGDLGPRPWAVKIGRGRHRKTRLPLVLEARSSHGVAGAWRCLE